MIAFSEQPNVPQMPRGPARPRSKEEEERAIRPPNIKFQLQMTLKCPESNFQKTVETQEEMLDNRHHQHLYQNRRLLIRPGQAGRSRTFER